MGGASWDRNLEYRDFLDQSFDVGLLPWVFYFHLRALEVDDTLVGAFVMLPRAGVVVELDIGQLRLSIG